ncbi:amidase [Motilibacter rhizosphaerae]|uniref:Amidase n=1 Tax=Motilibacter rhizosphaerae TaxID=598652 RepID=A0A4Q7NAU7_9ACTN|nr:amidase family protein [Motilibacter rhizosphaerae]RZS80039.1 amidase [Motilibacter rhizosphaerae]
MPHPSPRRRRAAALGCALATAGLALTAVQPAARATTTVKDDDGVITWDVNDASRGDVDDGSIATGGAPFQNGNGTNPFDGFGALRTTVSGRGVTAAASGSGHILRGFGLTYDGVDGWVTTAPVTLGGVRFSRSILVDPTHHWTRYVDTVTNIASRPRKVRVSFGGGVGYSTAGFPVSLMSQGGAHPADWTYVAATSSGDAHLATDDSWAVISDSVDGTAAKPAKHGPRGVLTGRADAYSDFRFASRVFSSSYAQGPRQGEADYLGVDNTLSLSAGRTASVVHFVTAAAPEKTATAGQQAAVVQGVLQSLTAALPLSDLTPAALCTVANLDVTSVAGYDAATCAKQVPLGPTAQPPVVPPTTTSRYPVAEKTVAQMLADMAAGRTTSVAITQAYIDRIAAYDRGQSGLNSYLYLDVAHALAEARAADAARAKGATGALLGIPVALKDLYDTKDMPTTGGSLALAGSRPTTDATAVARLRAAGAVILGKLNLSEFAWSGNYSQSGVGGSTYNPYDTDRSAAGSSGGTGASTAASLNAFSMGTDSCGSLQGVSGVTGLDTIRATRGLTSLAGVFPLEGFQDSAGPMTRSITDLATALTVLAGTDSKDALTAKATAHVPAGGYTTFLKAGALSGKRLGYLDYFPSQYADAAVSTHFSGVLAKLKSSGATVVDVTSGFNAATSKRSTAYYASGVWSSAHYRHDINAFLAANKGFTVKDVKQIAASGKAIPFLQSALEAAAKAKDPSAADLAKTAAAKKALAGAIEGFMKAHHLDALVYPTNADDPAIADGDRGFNQNCQISADSGLPGVTVATGTDTHGLPVGLEFLGASWTDGQLLGLAYSYEQHAKGTTVGRKAPKGYGNLAYARVS